MGEFIVSDEENAETDGLESAQPAPETLIQPPTTKAEIVRTPEEQERLRAVVGRVAMSERGKFFEEYRAENEAAAEFLTVNSLKVAEARGLDVPAEYLDNVQSMIDKLNENAGTGITMNEYVIDKIAEAKPEDLPALYVELVDISKPFAERGQTAPPSAEEIAEFVQAAGVVIDGRSAEDDPLGRVRELREIMFDVEGTRRDEDGESTLPADDIEATLDATISDIIESGNKTGVDSITSEDLIAITYANLKKKKVPASWEKVPRDIRTNIELAVQRVKEDHPGDIDVMSSSVGPIITFR